MRRILCKWQNQGVNVPSLAYMQRVMLHDETYNRGIYKHAHLTQISLIVSGSGDYFIQDNSYHVAKGDVTVINANILHSEGAILPSYTFGIKTPAIIDDSIAPVFHLKGDSFSIIEHLGAAAFELLKRNDLESHQLASNLVINSILPFLTQKISSSESVKKNNGVIVNRAKAFINENFKDSINIKDVCDELGVSHTYLDQKFQDEIGLTPIKYLMSRRVGEAQRLLLDDAQLSITQVSMMVGINNTNYFQRTFKTFVGVSPKKYRTLITKKAFIEKLW